MKLLGRFSLILVLSLICLLALSLTGCDQLTDLHQHSIVEHEGQAATCTSVGWLAYQTCSECDTYSTYVATQARGHKYESTYTPDGDVHTRACTQCSDVLVSAHSWGTPSVTDPTCTELGEKVYTCSDCGATKSETISLRGHDYYETILGDGSQGFACSRCPETFIVHTHNWEYVQTVTDPTCTTVGEDLYSCSECLVKMTVTTAILGHDYYETTLPTGQQGFACTRCSATIGVHVHEWGTPSVTEPTCTTSGTNLYICSVCSATKTETLSMLGHDYQQTELPDGEYGFACSRCSEALIGHQHDWKFLEHVIVPNCQDIGAQKLVCTVCSEVKVDITPIDPDVHTEYGWVTLTPATALVEGTKVRVCLHCHKQVETARIAPDVESMPIIYLEGNYQGAYVNGKKVEVDMTATYVEPDGTSFSSYATLKAQGSSSISYDKKNYTIKFYKDAEHESKNKIDLGWGKQNKYVMKANWVDYSQSRNVMSCRIWGDIVGTRSTSSNQQRLAALPTNGGAVDGYPIAVYMNGNFHGLYTMNVPKDEWMFGMGEKDENGNKSPTEALIASDDWNHTDFYSTIGEFVEDSSGDLIAKNGGWELIYHGGKDHAWVAKSFDALITFCQNNDGEAFRNGIRQYLDVEAAIDYLIYMYANCMHDNASKNMLWATYDGKTWIPSVYDQDGSFGQVWDGVRFSDPNSSLPVVKNGRIDVGVNYGPSGNNTPKFILWDRIWNCFTAEVLARYDDLRATVLSTEHIIAEYKKFEAMIPESMFEAEFEVWADSRASWWAGKGKTNPYDYTAYHYDYIYTWIENRMSCYDTAIAKIKSSYGY